MVRFGIKTRQTDRQTDRQKQSTGDKLRVKVQGKYKIHTLADNGFIRLWRRASGRTFGGGAQLVSASRFYSGK